MGKLKHIPKTTSDGLRATFALRKHSGITHFGFTFQPRNEPFYAVKLTIQGSAGHGTTAAMTRQRSWGKREPGNLWWTTITNTLQAKKTVRNYGSRKLARAFVLSLGEHGYDRDGWSLRGRQHGSLLGTLELHPFHSSVTASLDELRKEADSLVKWIEVMQNDKIVRQTKLGAKKHEEPTRIAQRDGARKRAGKVKPMPREWSTRDQ